MSLSASRAVSAIAVSDMGRAREFYEGKLGLSAGEQRPDGGIRYPCGGGTTIHVYPSPENAGRSTATLVGFEVDDVGGIVGELTSNGVEFERYDGFDYDEQGIARVGETQGAWLKDPDGNVLGLVGK